jgi:hypothetical protein
MYLLSFVSNLIKVHVFAVEGWHEGLNITQVVPKAYPWISNVIIVGKFAASVTVAYVGYVCDSENGKGNFLVSVRMASV